MSRIARAVLPDVPHHITQRGNARQVVFDNAEGRRLYLDLLRRNADHFQLSIWAFCLMSNHIHLIAVPERADSLARTLGRTHAEYAQYLNLCRRSCGHVWQARYYSCPLGDDHLWRAMAYVEQNPVRAQIIPRATDYPWSSAHAHVRESSLDGFLDLRIWRERFDGRSWQSILDQPSDEEAFLERLREATLRGRPWCNPQTLEVYEQRLGRTLRPKPSGRPREARTAVCGGK
jgi:putative transposase